MKYICDQRREGILINWETEKITNQNRSLENMKGVMSKEKHVGTRNSHDLPSLKDPD